MVVGWRAIAWWGLVVIWVVSLLRSVVVGSHIRTQLGWPHHKPGNQADDVPYQHDEEPEHTTFSPGFGIHIDPYGKENTDDKIPATHHKIPTKQEEAPERIIIERFVTKSLGRPRSRHP